EVLLPDPIHEDAGRQWVIRSGEPVGPGRPPAAGGCPGRQWEDGRRGRVGQHRKDARLNLASRGDVVAAAEDVRGRARARTCFPGGLNLAISEPALSQQGDSHAQRLRYGRIDLAERTGNLLR